MRNWETISVNDPRITHRAGADGCHYQAGGGGGGGGPRWRTTVVCRRGAPVTLISQGHRDPWPACRGQTTRPLSCLTNLTTAKHLVILNPKYFGQTIMPRCFSK